LGIKSCTRHGFFDIFKPLFVNLWLSLELKGEAQRQEFSEISSQLSLIDWRFFSAHRHQSSRLETWIIRYQKEAQRIIPSKPV